MSLLQHTGPSTFYTELAELPLPVSADFVASDGTYQLDQPLWRFTHNIYSQLLESLM